MTQLILLLVLGAVVAIGLRYRQQRQENRLRENYPTKRVIEVSLPRGISDSHRRMQKFYRKVSAATAGSDKERREGIRQVDVTYFVEVRPGSAMPQVRLLIHADEDKMETVKRSLKQVFDGMANVTELSPDEDPMAVVATELKPPPPPAQDDEAAESEAESDAEPELAAA